MTSEREERPMTTLTPYDTGDRLEPRLWVTPSQATPATDPDRFGRVDFDDDEGTTRATVWIEREPAGGYRLNVYLFHELMAVDLTADLVAEELPTDEEARR
jgi:hypothetical protein